jgi:ArsR family transcriptional regulator
MAYNMSKCAYKNVRGDETKMTDVFKALSDETRLRMLSLILNGEMCVCEIEDCLGLTQSNASRHLTALKTAGILSSSKQAQWAYYRLNEAFCTENRELINYLKEKLKFLSTYESDNKKREKCKQSDLCNKE